MDIATENIKGIMFIISLLQRKYPEFLLEIILNII